MKKFLLTLVLATFALSIAAQDGMRVNYKGAKPTITDFAWAYVFSDEDEEENCDQEASAWVKNALYNYRNGIPQNEYVTFLVDEKNGYISCVHENDGYCIRVEMCFWNEADKKHKLFAYSLWAFENGKPLLGQYDGITFCRYTNATKRMQIIDGAGFDVEYFDTCYKLPQKGKDIIVSKWHDDGTVTPKTLKWNGRRFVE